MPGHIGWPTLEAEHLLVDRPARLLASSALAAVTALGITPQIAGAASGDGTWPIDMWPMDVAGPFATTATPDTPETVTIETVVTIEKAETTVPVEPAPSAPDVTPVAPAPNPAPAPSPAPALASSATLHVEVATTDGATRTVSLRTAAGELAGGPVTVDGSTISFTDLAPGTYDLFVEEFADGGGTFLTRTPLDLGAGDERVARCDPDSLDCTA